MVLPAAERGRDEVSEEDPLEVAELHSKRCSRGPRTVEDDGSKGAAKHESELASRKISEKTTRSGKKLPQDKEIAVVALSSQGVQAKEIVRLLNISPASVARVRRRWKKLLPDIRNVEAFRAARADILDGVQSKSLKSMVKLLDDADTSLRDAVYCFKEVHAAARLERGQSTANIAHEVRHTKFVNLSPYDATPPPSEDLEG